MNLLRLLVADFQSHPVPFHSIRIRRSNNQPGDPRVNEFKNSSPPPLLLHLLPFPAAGWNENILTTQLQRKVNNIRVAVACAWLVGDSL